MNGWVWSNGGMVLTGENWSTGRKALYSAGGRWMDEYGAMVEWYWQGKTEVLGGKLSTVWVVDEWMSMEQWLNDTDGGNLKNWEKKHYSVWVVDEWMRMDYWRNVTDRGKLKFWEKSPPVPLRASQVTDALVWSWTRSSAVRPLPANARPQPILSLAAAGQLFTACTLHVNNPRHPLNRKLSVTQAVWTFRRR